MFSSTSTIQPTNTFSFSSVKRNGAKWSISFYIYKELFSYLNGVTELLEPKQKLSKYYGATDSESFGIVYTIATILCLSKKLRFFKGDN
ncbi:hypothetical protein N7505_007517 [Penicillium chrysogenum]|uniref:Uncharacterized protein n=1 Tax=Penicillium chrysogenum TaxID=5076 RepID=A0ABQ8WDU2_PENCH|nr:hypothetical protein N7505_007517 [Penicillium chrysogenum]